ncbi:MAG: hypothetical protein RLZZ493_1696 [Bacteroidota bacterium]|jgi:hypothetical protein
MKKIVFLSVIAFSLSAHAQQTIPNAGFETWTNSFIYEEPTGWATLNPGIALGVPTTVTKSTSAHSGTYAAKIKTVGADFDGDNVVDTIPGIAFLGTLDIISQTTNEGIPFSGMPDTLAAWTKYNSPSANDQFLIIATLTKWNAALGMRDDIASATIFSGSNTSVYTRQTAEFTYFSTDTPDTLSLMILSSAGQVPAINAELFVDDISFIYNNTSNLNESSISTWNVFPNPATDNITINATSEGEILLTDALGKTIETISVTPNNPTLVTVAHLSNGLYYLQQGDQLVKVVVQH